MTIQASPSIDGTAVASPKPLNRNGLTYRISLTKNPKFWSHFLYRGPNGRKVTVNYCRNIEESEDIARILLEEKVLGFDLEWVADNLRKKATGCEIKLNVSLMQIACENRIALFHIALHEGTTAEKLIAPSLRRLIESPSILKVGVNVLNADAKRLAKNLGMEPGGIMELSHLHNLTTPEFVGRGKKGGKGLVALATQVQNHMHLPLFKGKDIRCGRWDQELSWKQKQYAADDAYVGFMLYHKMNTDRLALDPVPLHPRIAKLNVVGGEILTTFYEYNCSSPITPTCPVQGDSIGKATLKSKSPNIPAVPRFSPYGSRYRSKQEGIEAVDLAGSDTPLIPKRVTSGGSFTTKTGLLNLSENDDEDDDDYFTTLDEVRQVKDRRPPEAREPEIAPLPQIMPPKSPQLETVQPEIQTQPSISQQALQMTGLTKRLYSALCALRIRLSLTTNPIASDKVLSELAWVNPRSTYELTLVSGGEALAEVLAERDVQLLAFIEKNVPMC